MKSTTSAELSISPLSMYCGALLLGLDVFITDISPRGIDPLSLQSALLCP